MPLDVVHCLQTMPLGVVLKILDFKKQFEYVEHIIIMGWKSRFEETLEEIITLPILSNCPSCNDLNTKRFRCCLGVMCCNCCIQCYMCNRFGCIHCIDIVEDNECKECQVKNLFN
jgi:hypothetical protein